MTEREVRLADAKRRTRELGLWAGALMGTSCMLMAICSSLFGITILSFQSGSMAPSYGVGTLALARATPAADLNVGDVVSVVEPAKERVTHRIVAIERVEDTATLTLQGDANRVVDPQSTTVATADRLFAEVPGLGTVADAATSTGGSLAIALLVVSLLITAFGKEGRERPIAVGAGAGVVIALGALLPGLLVPAALIRPTTAYWTDVAVATSGDLVAHTVVAPPPTQCSVTGNALTGYSAVIRWSNIATPTNHGYVAVVRNTGQPLTVSPATGGGSQVTVNSGLLGSLLGATVQIDIRSQIPGSPWVSEERRTRELVVGALGLGLSCGADRTSPA